MKPYYADDMVTLYHADCREETGWLDGDVMVTDPPYGIGWRIGCGTGGRAHHGIAGDADTVIRDWALTEWGNRPSVVFGSLHKALPAKLKQTLVWAKPADSGVYGSTTGFRRDVEAIYLCGTWPVRSLRYSSVLRSAVLSVAQTAKATGHPHSKPVDLLQQLIGAAPPGVVVDPFAGSGTTLVAAKRLGCRAIGVEIDERYAEVTASRLSQGVLNLGDTA